MDREIFETNVNTREYVKPILSEHRHHYRRDSTVGRRKVAV